MLRETDTLTLLQDQKPFLSKVVQTLQTEWADLDDHLQQAQWSQAKEKAHQLKGIFYLLDGSELLLMLQHIEDKNLPLISEPEFRQQLQQQIDYLEQKLSNL